MPQSQKILIAFDRTIADISDLVKDDLNCVNQVILNNMHSDVALIPQVAHYIIAAGGKRIRPLITLLVAKAFNYTGNRHINLAACVEFIHTATLLHDDVVDTSDQRRGQPTVNSVWGNETSVLVGDFLFSRAFQLMVQDQDLTVLEILSSTSAQIAEGEIHQLMRLQDITLTKHDYYEIIKFKTAVLFAAASQVGCLINQASPEQQKQFYNYGYHLGMVFQIVDDVLDYRSNQDSLGKTVGQDFKEGKVTLPIIMALGQADLEQQAFWQQVIGCEKRTQQDFAQALDYMNQHNVFALCYDIADQFAKLAYQDIQDCPNVIYKQALADLVSLTLARIA